MNDILEITGDLMCNHLTGDRGVTAKIKQAMKDAAKQFVYIGFLLWEVKQYEYFYEMDYNNVYEYAETELGFKRSSTKNFIAICETFCRRDKHYTSLPTMFLDERWSDYQYSQLTEMLAISPAQRKKTTPNMTVRQLRDMKKAPAIIDAAEQKIDFKMLDQAISAGQTSGHEYRWIKARTGKSPQAGNFPMKLVAYKIYVNNKPQIEYALAFYRNEEWTRQNGSTVHEVIYYSELPPKP